MSLTIIGYAQDLETIVYVYKFEGYEFFWHSRNFCNKKITTNVNVIKLRKGN